MRWLVTLLAVALGFVVSIHGTSITQDEQQLPLIAPDTSARTRFPLVHVPGTNNATYGPVPEPEQLFEIEYLEIAPSPFGVDRVVFAWLRGSIRAAARSIVTESDLIDAMVSITLSATYADGTEDEPQTYTIPLQAMAYNSYAHLAIRNSEGAHVDSLSVLGANDILLDMWILGDWMRAGDWTFAFAAELADGRSLFAVSLTQYLDGNLRVS